MVKQASAERRQWLRARRILSIQFRLAKKQRQHADSGWHLSTTQDMSLGGLTFYTDVEYRSGDILEIHVVMSGVLDIFNGYAKIVRLERKKTGAYYFVAVQFITNKPKRRSAKSYHLTKRITEKV